MKKLFDPRETSFGISNRSFGLGVLVLSLLFLVAFLLLKQQITRERIGDLLVAFGVLTSCDLAWFQSSVAASTKVVLPCIGWAVGVAQGVLPNRRLEQDIREAIPQKDIVFFLIPLILLTGALLATVTTLDVCSYGERGPGNRVWTREYGFGVGLLTYFSSLVATTYFLSLVRYIFRR